MTEIEKIEEFKVDIRKALTAIQDEFVKAMNQIREEFMNAKKIMGNIIEELASEEGCDTDDGDRAIEGDDYDAKTLKNVVEDQSIEQKNQNNMLSRKENENVALFVKLLPQPLGKMVEPKGNKISVHTVNLDPTVANRAGFAVQFANGTLVHDEFWDEEESVKAAMEVIAELGWPYNRGRLKAYVDEAINLRYEPLIPSISFPVKHVPTGELDENKTVTEAVGRIHGLGLHNVLLSSAYILEKCANKVYDQFIVGDMLYFGVEIDKVNIAAVDQLLERGIIMWEKMCHVLVSLGKLGYMLLRSGSEIKKCAHKVLDRMIERYARYSLIEENTVWHEGSPNNAYLAGLIWTNFLLGYADNIVSWEAINSRDHMLSNFAMAIAGMKFGLLNDERPSVLTAADHGKQIAVIKSEFGKVDIDGSLVANERLQTYGSCTYCSNILCGGSSSNEVKLDGVTTLVDAKHTGLLRGDVKPKRIVKEDVEHIAYADSIIMNITDFVDEPVPSCHVESIGELSRRE